MTLTDAAAPVVKPTAREHRPELQALRALAVGVVVVYHLWPRSLPGGFIGVDVFFVLSGFLITSHLLREIAQHGTVSFADFWARRIRRLLPASFVVLGASMLLLFLVPQTVWQQGLAEIRAAGLYIENWVLAVNSVDYLAAENEPSIVQHFWSLSVEEQFYFIWPLILVATGAMAVRMGVSRLAAIRVVLVMLGASSFAFSVVFSITAPGPAYFATPTRAWEFAAGGVLAAFPLLAAKLADHTAARIVLSWTGLLLIVGSALGISGEYAFPGWVAAIPVFGTLLVIVAGQLDSAAAPTFYGRFRVVQWIGDLSYSIYLWHWPVLVVVIAVVGGLRLRDAFFVIAATLVLAFLTKRYVEDPVRTGQWWFTRRRTFGLLAGGMTAILVITSIAGAIISGRQAILAEEAQRVASCIGAAALQNEDACAGVVPEDALFPELAGVAEDTGTQYDCYIVRGGSYQSCEYGPENADTVVAIVGDSHAASLLPGLTSAAEELGIRVVTLVGNGCILGFPQSCAAGVQIDEVVRDTAFDAVLTTQIRRDQPELSSLVKAWDSLIDDGVKVVPIVDVPVIAEATHSCLVRNAGKTIQLFECATPRKEALESLPDRYGLAAEALEIPSIDLTDILCDAEECPAVIGHALVYRDAVAHITATFSATLADDLKRDLDRVLVEWQSPAGGSTKLSP